MELSEKELEQLANDIAAEVWTSGDFRGYTSDELTQAVRDGVRKGVKKLDEKRKPLYYFEMRRLNLLDTENIPMDRIEQAEKKHARIQVVAEDQRGACIEAGRISGDAGDGHMWLFITESISPYRTHYLR